MKLTNEAGAGFGSTGAEWRGKIGMPSFVFAGVEMKGFSGAVAGPNVPVGSDAEYGIWAFSFCCC